MGTAGSSVTHGPTGRPRWAAEALRFTVYVGAVGLACALLLVMPTTLGLPERSLWADLRSLAISIVGCSLYVYLYARHRYPELRWSAVRLALVIFLFRTALLLIAVSWTQRLSPMIEGFIGSDSMLWSVQVRAAMLDPSAQQSGLLTTEQAARWYLMAAKAAEELELFYYANPVDSPLDIFQSLFQSKAILMFDLWIVILAAICSVTGYSTVAVVLPMVGVSALASTLCWLLVRSLWGRQVAKVVAVWLALSLAHGAVAVGLYKDFGCAVAIVYLCDQQRGLAAGKPRSAFVCWLLAMVWMFVFRPDISLLAVGLGATIFAIHYSPPRWKLTVAVVLGSIASAVILSQARQPVRAELGSTPLSLIGNLFVVPVLLHPARFTIGDGVSLSAAMTLPLALLWPAVASSLVAGFALRRRLTVPLPIGVAMVMCVWYVAVAASGYGLMHRMRIPIDPLLVGLALAIVADVRHQPPAVRRSWARYFAVVWSVLVLVQLLPLMVLAGYHPGSPLP